GWRYSDPHLIMYDADRYRNAGAQARRDFYAHGADHRAPPAGDSTSRRTTLSGDELAHVLWRADAAARKDRRARQAVPQFRPELRQHNGGNDHPARDRRHRRARPYGRPTLAPCADRDR